MSGDVQQVPADYPQYVVRFNSVLGDRSTQLRETVQDFAQHKIAPRAEEIDAATISARPVAPEEVLGRARAITVEDELRRSGRAPVALRRHGGSLRRASGFVGTVLCGRIPTFAYNHILRQTVMRGAEAPLFCRDLISVEHVGALAISCRAPASDVTAMRTQATKKKKSAATAYILNRPPPGVARRVDPPTARRAEPWWAYAKTDPKAGARGITAFLIEKGSRAFPPPKSSTSSACAAPTPAIWCFPIARCRPNGASGRGAGVTFAHVGPRLGAGSCSRPAARHHAACLDAVDSYLPERKHSASRSRLPLIAGSSADM